MLIQLYKNGKFITFSTLFNRNDLYKVVDVISNVSAKLVELELRSFVTLTP